MAGSGEILTEFDYAGMSEYLDGLDLERVVAANLSSLGVDHVWLNEHGEANGFPDMFVGGAQLDCKGSKKYYGSMFMGVGSFETMSRRQLLWGEFWFVLNDLSVVSFTEFDTGKQRKSGGYRMKPSKPKSLREWLQERNLI